MSIYFGYLSEYMLKINLENQTLQKLRQQLTTTHYAFLGFTLNLEAATLTDNLCINKWTDLGIKLIPAMLSHYAVGIFADLTGKFMKFRDLPGGYSYERAFINRAIKPIEETFGQTPNGLVEAAKKLGGNPLDIGDASAEIPTLRGIPLTYVLYGAEDYPASANVFYDESASSFLPTEDLAVLGELTTLRLIAANF